VRVAGHWREIIAKSGKGQALALRGRGRATVVNKTYYFEGCRKRSGGGRKKVLDPFGKLRVKG